MSNIDFTKVQVGECDVYYKLRASKNAETDHAQNTSWLNLGAMKDKILLKGVPITTVLASGHTAQVGMKLDVESMPIEQFEAAAIAALDDTKGVFVDILFVQPDNSATKVLRAMLTYAPDGEFSPENPMGMKVGFNTNGKELADILTTGIALEW